MNPFEESPDLAEMRPYPVHRHPPGAIPSLEGPPVPPESSKPRFGSFRRFPKSLNRSQPGPAPPPKSPWRTQFFAHVPGERPDATDDDEFDFSQHQKPYSVINDAASHHPSLSKLETGYNAREIDSNSNTSNRGGNDDTGSLYQPYNNNESPNETSHKTAVYDHYYNLPQRNTRTPNGYGYGYSPELNNNDAAFGTDEIQPIAPRGYGGEDDDLMREKYARNRHHRKQKRRGLFSQYNRYNFPYLTYLFSAIQVIVLIVELAKMGIYTGSPFQTKPYFNPMIGPSTYLLVNMGARYVPCMQTLEGISNDTSIQYPCANSTSTDTFVCSLSELCGLGGIPVVNDEYKPHQWYRVIIPIFMHAGIIHILFNLLLQILMGSIIELSIGSLRYFVIYFMSGILGFLLGANFAPDGIASTGALGALFGVLAINMVLFIWAGKHNNNIYNTNHYMTFIVMMVVEIVILFVLGLLPGLDNFSHIGGFAQGLALSVALLDDPFFVFIGGKIPKRSSSRWYKDLDSKIRWRFYAWCGMRVVFLTLGVVFMAMLIHNFFDLNHNYTNNGCSWCKYINCLPVNGWCDQGQISVTTTTTSANGSNNSKRSLLAMFHEGGYAESGSYLGAGFYCTMAVVGVSFWYRNGRENTEKDHQLSPTKEDAS